jgi:hypothetical protein
LVVYPAHRAPREVLYYRVANGHVDDYDEHRIEIGLILELITPGQSEIAPGRAVDNGPGT